MSYGYVFSETTDVRILQTISKQNNEALNNNILSTKQKVDQPSSMKRLEKLAAGKAVAPGVAACSEVPKSLLDN